MTDPTPAPPPGRPSRKNIGKSGQMVRILAGASAILLGLMAPSLDRLWILIPIVNHQGATGRCWLRAMGFRTPL